MSLSHQRRTRYDPIVPELSLRRWKITQTTTVNLLAGPHVMDGASTTAGLLAGSAH
jgi:hypothetical protein